MSEPREYSPKRFAISSGSCPSCRAKVDREAKWCDFCGFTGEKSLDIFGNNPPPLVPILDVVDFWSEKDKRRIKSAAKEFGKRFPQIHWRFCAVALDPEASLPMFGFWMMNVCPLAPGETTDDREWTVVLLVDSNKGKVSVTTGYRAELWLSDDMWEKALAETTDLIEFGQPGKAVVRFLKAATGLFEVAWKRTQEQLPSDIQK